MTGAIHAGVVTGGSLRREAAALQPCQARLLALGAAPAQDQAAYQQAKLACVKYEQAARFGKAAARAYTLIGEGSSFTTLLNRETAAINAGDAAMATAVADLGF